jgi:uncharacterized protein (TIGR00369 family)
MAEGDDERRAYYEGLARFFEENVNFNKLLGIKVDELRDGHARLRVPFRDELVGDPFRLVLHGGVLSSLIDTAGGMAGFTTVTPDDRLSTVDLRVDYLRPAGAEDLVAEAKVLRVGNRVAVCDIVVHHGDPERPVATGTAVYNVRRAADPT